MIYLTIFSTIIALGLGVFAKSRVPHWQARDFGDKDFKWNLLIGTSVGISIVLAHVAFFLSGNLYTSLTVGIAAFGVWLLSATDFILMKIPHEITTVLPWISFPMMVAFWPSFDFYDKTSIYTWASLVFVFGVLSLFRFFGWADVKIMFAFLTLFSWWIGPILMTYGLLLASILALLALPITKKLGFGTVKKTIKDTHTYNQETQKLESVSRFADEEFEGLNRKAARKKIGKKKTYLAFGPALLVSYLIMALVASATASVDLYTWWS